MKKKSLLYYIFIFAFLAITFFYSNKNPVVTITENRLKQMVLKGDVKKIILYTNKKIVNIEIKPEVSHESPYKEDIENNTFLGMKSDVHYILHIPSAEIFNENFKKIEELLPESERLGYESKEGFDIFNFILNWSSLIFILLLFLMFFRRGSSIGSGGIFSIGKAKTTLIDKDNKKDFGFDNVAGVHEAKEELKEIVDFLKSSDKYVKIGAKIPKGILLVGEPGTGKTLLAKAVAGEANVPFFSISGSDFVEMFAGVGAARVRDLFQQAQEKAPAVIFIDEIDTIGKARNNSYSGINTEHDSTLNALLVEMDGFEPNNGIVVIAATNRMDVLDKALLRPGRFDRHISIDIPDIIDREEIIKLYLKNISVNEDIDAKRFAELTPGFTGADIANVCNEAALIAARNNKEKVEKIDIHNALDRVIGGLEKKHKLITPEEKEIIAYHEAGHALVSWFLPNAEPLLKVTIIPRGIAALGYSQYLPKENYIKRKENLLDNMCATLGGRVSEEIIFNKISTGAVDDLSRVTQMAYSIIRDYGMSKTLGNISYVKLYNEDKIIKPFSETTAFNIDKEVFELVRKEYERAKDLLIDKKDKLILLAKNLLEKEVLYKSDIEKLF